MKQLRQKHQESVAEVSGAVEIDMTMLGNYEAGQTRPSEDILLLLISHFNMNEDEAAKLWQLAGYDQQKLSSTASIEEGPMTQNIIVMPLESRVAYTDQVNVATNEFGVVINFMQVDGPGGQPLVVSRVGMSKEHAKIVLEALQKSFQIVEPKALPAPRRSKRQRK